MCVCKFNFGRRGGSPMQLGRWVGVGSRCTILLGPIGEAQDTMVVLRF